MLIGYAGVSSLEQYLQPLGQLRDTKGPNRTRAQNSHGFQIKPPAKPC